LKTLTDIAVDVQIRLGDTVSVIANESSRQIMVKEKVHVYSLEVDRPFLCRLAQFAPDNLTYKFPHSKNVLPSSIDGAFAIAIQEAIHGT
jgi:hypothetical protein